MKRAGTSLAGTAIVAIAGLVVLSNAGLIGISWPWERIDIPDVLTEETAIAQPAEATITRVEPMAIDCRARIRATVPVEGRRAHKMLGQVYRTDTVELVAVGDIDTCVSARGVDIVETVDGGFHVTVPASAITFERPRVDAVATAGSVHFDKGLVGKLTDVLPWVSDNSGLTPAAYAFAQDVVGSSECMASAWTVTETVVKTAYQEQLAAQGGDRGQVTVVIDGAPDFAPAPAANVGAFSFGPGQGRVNCRVDANAYDVTDSVGRGQR